MSQRQICILLGNLESYLPDLQNFYVTCTHIFDDSQKFVKLNSKTAIKVPLSGFCHFENGTRYPKPILLGECEQEFGKKNRLVVYLRLENYNYIEKEVYWGFYKEFLTVLNQSKK